VAAETNHAHPVLISLNFRALTVGSERNTVMSHRATFIALLN
jgi:hypothetical protein